MSRRTRQVYADGRLVGTESYDVPVEQDNVEEIQRRLAAAVATLEAASRAWTGGTTFTPAEKAAVRNALVVVANIARFILGRFDGVST